MANTIHNFASALRESARPNQFSVEISFPSFVARAVDHVRDSTYLVKSATIPEVTVEDITLMYRGRQYHEAGEKTFQPWTCTIYNSANFAIRSALENWANGIQHSENIGGLTDPTQYKGSVFIKHLNRNGDVLREYKLVGAYPTTIGQIQLDYESGNQVETFDVTFTYDYFVSA